MAPRRPEQGSFAPHTPGKAHLKPAYELSNHDPRVQARAAGVAQRQPAPAPALDEDLIFMVTDIHEEGQGAFNLFGTTARGASILLRLADFLPYFYCAAPQRQAGNGEGNRARQGSSVTGWEEADLERLRGLLNAAMPSHAQLESVEAMHRRPLMYYRPDQPDGATFLRLMLAPGSSVKQAHKAVRAAMLSGALRREGLVWRDGECYEHEVPSLLRFLVDVPASGGAWLLVPSGEWAAVLPGAKISRCSVEAQALCSAVRCLTPDAVQLADHDWSPFGVCGTQAAGSGSTHDSSAAGDTKSRCAGMGEGSEAWLGQRPPSRAALQAAAAAKRGDIAPLRCMAVDVLMATPDGADRVAVAAARPELGRPEGDPIVAIACTIFTTAGGGSGRQQVDASYTPAAVAAGADTVREDEGMDDGDASSAEEEDVEEGGLAGLAPAAVVDAIRPGRAAAAAGQPCAGPTAAGAQALVFLLCPAAAAERREVAERSMALGMGVTSASRVLLFGSEEELLLSWAASVRAADPDVLACFQVNNTLAVLQQRFSELNLEPLKLSRLLPHRALPLTIKAVTQYSAQWVRRESRMSNTSNQITYKAGNMQGRLVVDALRHCITAQSLETFSLVDCTHKLLGQTLEVLQPSQLARLAGLTGEAWGAAAGMPGTSASGSAAAVAGGPEGGAMRLARYALRRCDVVCSLLHRLATIPEMIESARATGLTLVQVVRVHSLLLRTARRQGYLVPGKQEEADLSETTFILHPEQAGTIGMHRRPVAVLDFASLYPSIYRAHNLCYSTLLHKADVQSLPPDMVTVTPTGEAFVKADVRPGLLPGILSALVAARGMAREQLKAAADPTARAVLDGRQKAIKLTSNALYGFTATKISPLQCPEAADACLAIGRESTGRAKELVEQAGREGRLGRYGAGARVLYGHTDSIFVLLPQASTPAQAIQAGRLAAQEVTSRFPEPMRLAFERVFHPFLLLHVNRYAGAAFEREDEAQGQLMVKGIKSMWRQTAPIVRTTLYGVLQRLILHCDAEGAAEYAKSQIRRLLTGQVDMNELAMSGGLWRMTGEQVERLAAGTAGPSDEEIRGPHNALAVRIQQRDPGRSFVLGERLQYVLLAGHQKQDDAAEDPLTAAKRSLQAAYNLYWQKKMQTPLVEIFKACLAPSQEHILRDLTGGDHTRVKVDMLTPAEAPVPPPAGPASPPPAPKGRGGRGGRTGRGGRGSSGGSSGPSSPAQQQQRRLNQFYRQTPKCLACRANMPRHTMQTAPALCDACASTEGRRQEVYLGVLADQSGEEARRSAAFAACRDCHSGGLAGPVLCENGECPLAYMRLSSATRLQRLDDQLRRLDIF